MSSTLRDGTRHIAMRLILIAQLLTAISIGAFYLLIEGPGQAVAAMTGGLIALTNGLLIARRIAREGKRVEPTPETEVRSMFAGAIERFVLIAILMAAGMTFWINQSGAQLALLFGFIAGQFSLITFARLTRS